MLPLGKSLDIGTAGNWELAWAGVKQPTEEDKQNYRLNRRWIYPFDIPVLIESPVIAVKANYALAPATWGSAGTLIRTTPFPKDDVALDEEAPAITAVIDRRYVRLNSEFEILVFNQSSDTLRLTFIPKPWLPSIGIVIYAYTGPITDEVLEQLAAVRAKLETIDAQVG